MLTPRTEASKSQADLTAPAAVIAEEPEPLAPTPALLQDVAPAADSDKPEAKEVVETPFPAAKEAQEPVLSE